MESLEIINERLLANTSLEFRRYLYDEIELSNRLILIMGCRGVGKTTMLLQLIKENLSAHKSIYISLDNLHFSTHTLLETLNDFYNRGYRTFALDEIHKYPNWSMELKNAYDSFPDIRLWVTSSSALDIHRGAYDLSRRVAEYTLRGLSFREYLHYEGIANLPVLSFKDLMENHVALAENYSNLYPILKHFKAYLNKGYYPFYKESGKKYHDRVRAIVNQVIEVDLPAIFNIDYYSVRQIKKLLSVISELSPFSPNVAKLSTSLEIPRARIVAFIDYLEKAGLLHTLRTIGKSDSVMTKPDKVFLENTNLMEALAMVESDVGTSRESFFMSALVVRHSLSTPAAGDFMVDSRYVFEIGGKNKDFHQIRNMPNAHLAKDDIAVGRPGVVPLWIFGLLY
jgi:uncharacterized protein